MQSQNIGYQAPDCGLTSLESYYSDRVDINSEDYQNEISNYEGNFGLIQQQESSRQIEEEPFYHYQTVKEDYFSNQVAIDPHLPSNYQKNVNFDKQLQQIDQGQIITQNQEQTNEVGVPQKKKKLNNRQNVWREIMYPFEQDRKFRKVINVDPEKFKVFLKQIKSYSKKQIDKIIKISKTQNHYFRDCALDYLHNLFDDISQQKLILSRKEDANQLRDIINWINNELSPTLVC